MNKNIIRQILLERTDRSGLPSQKEIANFLARYYPEESKEDKLFHDNWGLYSKNPDGVVKKILLCTTPTQNIIQFAKNNQYDLVISHHDFLFNNPDVPQIIYHSAMDEAERGHNQYFMRKLGLRNIQQHHKVLLSGQLYKPLTLDEFKNHIIKRGFEINGLVWESSNADNKISTVLYCSGMGGMLLSPNHIIDARNHPADVYVTGELTSNPDYIRNNPFKYIIELGHTSSEKPLFKWVKNMLRNRWQNVIVDLADKEMDIWGTDTYKAKMERDAKYEKEWEERMKEYGLERDRYGFPGQNLIHQVNNYGGYTADFDGYVDDYVDDYGVYDDYEDYNEVNDSFFGDYDINNHPIIEFLKEKGLNETDMIDAIEHLTPVINAYHMRSKRDAFYDFLVWLYEFDEEIGDEVHRKFLYTI